MNDDEPKAGNGWDGSGAHSITPPPPSGPPLPYVTRRPKRRRKGQLNDGQWAPGYGPDAKKAPPVKAGRVRGRRIGLM